MRKIVIGPAGGLAHLSSNYKKPTLAWKITTDYPNIDRRKSLASLRLISVRLVNLGLFNKAHRIMCLHNFLKREYLQWSFKYNLLKFEKELASGVTKNILDNNAVEVNDERKYRKLYS
jgi:hypothetical protein